MAGKIEYPPGGGMLVHYQGHPFPEKIFPFPEAFYCLDAVKRAMMNALRVVQESRLVGFATLLLCLWPFKTKLLYTLVRQFFEFSGYSLLKIRLEPQYYCQSGREILRAGEATIEKLAKTDDQKFLGKQILNTLLTIWEFDNAYRYRGQDLMATINKEEMVKHPIRAVRKLCFTAASRDRILHDKFHMISVGVTIFMLNRFVRRAVKTFFENVNLEALYLDTGDRYWCYHFGEYSFDGLQLDARINFRQMIYAAMMKKEDEPVSAA